MFSRGDLSEQERRQLRKNIMPVMEARMDERVDKYHELSTEDERKAYLDEMIDWMQTRMAQRPRRPESGRTDAQAGQGEDGQLPRGHPRFSPEGMKERIETTDPVKKARFAEFLKAMRKRMEERGIAFPHGGRGGRGR